MGTQEAKLCFNWEKVELVMAVSREIAEALDSTQGTVTQKQIDLDWVLALGKQKGALW